MAQDVSTRSVFVPGDELGLKHHVARRSTTFPTPGARGEDDDLPHGDPTSASMKALPEATRVHDAEDWSFLSTSACAQIA